MEIGPPPKKLCSKSRGQINPYISPQLTPMNFSKGELDI